MSNLNKMNAAASKELNRQIIDYLGQSILRKEPICEIRDMLVETVSFKQALYEWRDFETGLNIMQLAVSCDYAAVVKLLSEDKHEYMFTWFSDESTKKVNHPFHLACRIGAFETLKYFVSSRDEDCVHDILKRSLAVTYPRKMTAELPEDQLTRKTPFSWCLEGGHLECAKLLSTYIVLSIYNGTMHETSGGTVLHQACFLGSGTFLQMLLASRHISQLNKKDARGHTPFHVAALYARGECLEILLKYKISINATAGCKTALHLMYGSKGHPDRFTKCTRILLQHGIDANMMDLNHNTALDYLAWELGQRRYPDSNIRDYASQFIEAETIAPAVSAENYNAKVIDCMKMLLEAGASTVVRTPDGLIDHTIVHTLLRNTSWPISSFITRYPRDLYRALRLLFDFGGDPNVVAKNNNESAFTMLLVHILCEVDDTKLKCDLVHLFIISGADLDSCVPKPKQFRENCADRFWDVYPVMLALQECQPIAVLQLMFNFMSLHHIAMMDASCLWFRIKQKFRMNGGADRSGYSKYKARWQGLVKNLFKARSLKHSCKLAVLNHLKMKGQMVRFLPLPAAIKQYIISEHC